MNPPNPLLPGDNSHTFSLYTESLHKQATKATKENVFANIECRKKRNFEGHVSARLPQKQLRKMDGILPGTTFFIFIPCIGAPSWSAKAPRICGWNAKLSLYCKRFWKTKRAQSKSDYLFRRGSLWDTDYGYCIGNTVFHACIPVVLILLRMISSLVTK